MIGSGALTFVQSGAAQTWIDAGGDTGLGDQVIDLHDSPNFKVEGLTISGGIVYGSGEAGGGLRANAAAIILNSAIQGNSATIGGG